VSLKEKVAAALADLESIKSQSYRPSTAAAGSSTSRDATLPRPHLGPSSSSSKPSAHSSAAAERAAEELRTAKSILRKLYRKNVQLSADIKRLRSRSSTSASQASLSPTHASSSPPPPPLHEGDFDADETKLLMREAQESEQQDGEEQDEEGEGGEDDEDGPASPSKRSSAKNGGGGGKNALGGASHLLFLLGERDTTINKLQAQVQSLHRKVNGMTGRLELGGGAADAAAGSEGMFSDASGGERYHKQLEVLRRSFGEKLRAQMVQLHHMGEPAPSARLSAYVSDLERWLIWEASWRQVEKTALNAQCVQAEKQAQERLATKRHMV
jgi:hypothetical protein